MLYVMIMKIWKCTLQVGYRLYYKILERKLLVLNEVQNFGEGKYANFDTLKSIITETDIRVEEKYVAKRATEQVVNLILLSNNSLPVYVEETDRRYCFIETNAEFAEQNVKDDESKIL